MSKRIAMQDMAEVAVPAVECGMNARVRAAEQFACGFQAEFRNTIACSAAVDEEPEKVISECAAEIKIAGHVAFSVFMRTGDEDRAFRITDEIMCQLASQEA